MIALVGNEIAAMRGARRKSAARELELEARERTA
jgi:hypothetical protein